MHNDIVADLRFVPTTPVFSVIVPHLCLPYEQLLFHIETFYRENLRQDTEFSSSIDLLGVAKNASPEGIRAVVQLLVGAAVSCNEKADFIEAMMQASRSEVSSIGDKFLMSPEARMCCVAARRGIMLYVGDTFPLGRRL